MSSEPGWQRLSEQHLPIARNTATLAVIQALYSAVLQLGAAVLSLSFVLVTGFRSLLGAGPAIFLTASALAALPAGRAMDRFGRVPVIVGRFPARLDRLQPRRRRDALGLGSRADHGLRVRRASPER